MSKEADFSNAAATYKQNAIVQKKMASDLCFLLSKNFGTNFEKIFEIGSGTGLLTENIVNNLTYKELILNDLTKNYTNFDFTFLKGNVEEIELPEMCDLIVSGACFQWINNPLDFFVKLKGSLNKKGVLAFSSFGDDNCLQFRKILGLGLKYPNYEELLNLAGYEVIHYECEIDSVYFKRFQDVLKHIKYTGALVKSDKVWTKEDYKNFEKKYKEEYYDENGYCLTYNPVYVLAVAK